MTDKHSNQGIPAAARLTLMVAVFFGFFSVAIGAFAAHSLKARLSEYSLSIVETGARYQMYHALALLGVGLSFLIPGISFGKLKVASISMAAGTFIFSGSLYVLALSGIKWLGMITPIGGLGMLIGWLMLFVCYFQLSKSST